MLVFQRKNFTDGLLCFWRKMAGSGIAQVNKGFHPHQPVVIKKKAFEFRLFSSFSE